jgi:DNA-binding MarR family transcriptional regulator
VKTATRAPLSITPAGALDEARLHQILGYQLAQAAIVTYAVFERIVGTPLDLRPVEYTILALVSENPGVSPVQLSKALAVTRANITTWIDKLEQRGLAKREQNTSDRRGQHLRTTERGAALAKKATRLLVDGERQSFSTLTAVEQMMLTELLHKLGRARSKVRAPQTPQRGALLNDYRPDWIGAVSAGISALISFAIAKGFVKGTQNQLKFYLVLGACTVVLSLAAREVLRYLGI